MKILKNLLTKNKFLCIIRKMVLGLERFFSFLRKKKILSLLFFYNQEVPDNQEIIKAIEIKKDAKILKAFLFLNGDGDYVADLTFTLSHNGRIIWSDRVNDEGAMVFNITKDLTPILEGLSAKGYWALEVKDCWEEDENRIIYGILVLVVR